MLRSLTILLLGAVTLLPLAGNTRNGLGTIVGIDWNEAGEQNGDPTFTVCYEFQNLRPHGFRSYDRFAIAKNGAPQIRFFLDGQAATAREALRVGRAIYLCNNNEVAFVASQSGPEAAMERNEARVGLVQVVVEHPPTLPVDRLRNRRNASPMNAPVLQQLYLDVAADGSVRAGGALGVDRVIARLDVTQLAVQDGRLRGSWSAKVYLGHQFRSGQDTAAMPPYRFAGSLDVPVLAGPAEQGDGGTFTWGDDQSSPARAYRLGVQGIDGPRRIWLDLDHLPDARFNRYLVIPFTDDDQAREGRLLFAKGYQMGTITAQDLQLVDGRLQGSVALTGTRTGGDEPLRARIDGHLLGNRLVIATVTIGDWSTTCLGGVLGDAIGRMHGFDRREYKALQADQPLE